MPEQPYDPDRPHPFAQQARRMCTETHDDAMPCEYCWHLERRLEPVSWWLGDVLKDADLTVTYRRDGAPEAGQ